MVQVYLVHTKARRPRTLRRDFAWALALALGGVQSFGSELPLRVLFSYEPKLNLQHRARDPPARAKRRFFLQGYLTNEKMHPPRTLPSAYA